MNAIELDSITKVFSDKKVLSDVSFKVEKGSIHGLLGPNGAGKTTTLKIITNLMRQTSGEVRINGEARSFDSKSTSTSLGFLLENSPLYSDMTVREYLTFVGKLRQMSKQDISNNLDYCIKSLDLDSVLNRGIENLSRGFKQRVGIAQALIHMPEILILDEPTIGLDPQSVIDIRELILGLKKEHTIILSSHLLHEMSLVCDDVTIIAGGSIKDTGTISDLRKRLASRAQFKILTLKRNDAFMQYLIDHEDILEVKLSQEADHYIYHLQYTGSTEIRHLLLEKAIELELNPIGLEKSESSLEEIFMKVTQ